MEAVTASRSVIRREACLVALVLGLGSAAVIGFSRIPALVGVLVASGPARNR